MMFFARRSTCWFVSRTHLADELIGGQVAWTISRTVDTANPAVLSRLARTLRESLARFRRIDVRIDRMSSQILHVESVPKSNRVQYGQMSTIAMQGSATIAERCLIT